MTDEESSSEPSSSGVAAPIPIERAIAGRLARSQELRSRATVVYRKLVRREEAARTVLVEETSKAPHARGTRAIIMLEQEIERCEEALRALDELLVAAYRDEEKLRTRWARLAGL